MFKRLLIASEYAIGNDDILRCLKGFRKFGASECLIVQCLHPAEGGIKISSFFGDVAQASLQKQKEALIDLGYSVETRVVQGYIKDEIARIAQDESYSIVVVGESTQTLMQERVFSGTAYDVIRHVSKPVLVVRIADHCGRSFAETGGCDITNHILFPTDFSDNAGLAFDYVKKMAAEGAAKITLIHVQDKSRLEPYLSDRIEEFNEKDQQRLLEMQNELMRLGDADVDISLTYGSPAVELLKLIRERNISLTIMGNQGRGFVKELFLGSVSNNIARQSPSSVLLVPAARE